ncbi:hypothetical protein AAFF_G00079590 [Aldrovandia affinis]|uniref:Uncharacterized protein n=1 Tax=Aldrovandia affinis TaxID=143900 RepID=A0AAD7RXF2_9TELE|nr:hypothetical protein AAFF_G00079590 [Aldrovandia affinis]
MLSQPSVITVETEAVEYSLALGLDCEVKICALQRQNGPTDTPQIPNVENKEKQDEKKRATGNNGIQRLTPAVEAKTILWDLTGKALPQCPALHQTEHADWLPSMAWNLLIG